MTSQERHEARYQRRKAKRQERKQARCDALGPVDKVFSYRKMFYYGRKCCNGVRWKQSAQNFELHLFSGTAKRRREVLDGSWTPKKCTHFTLCERGKVRPIDAPHDLIYQRHQELILNPDLREIADKVIRFSPCPAPGRGMPLGVEPSQQEMVALPSSINNWIKCQARVHCDGHYMDDNLLIFPTIEEAKLMGHEIVRRFEAKEIRVNKKKCKMIPLTKPFWFCKARFTLTETGQVKINGSRDGIKRARRKLKLFHREFMEGKRPFFDIEQFMECQSSYYRNFDDHGRLLRLQRLYYAIFFGGSKKCSELSKTGPALA